MLTQDLNRVSAGPGPCAESLKRLFNITKKAARTWEPLRTTMYWSFLCRHLKIRNKIMVFLCNLFQGYKIHITKSVQPEPPQMRDIISCSGATFLPKMPSSRKVRSAITSSVFPSTAGQLKSNGDSNLGFLNALCRFCSKHVTCTFFCPFWTCLKLLIDTPVGVYCKTKDTRIFSVYI